MQVTTKQVTAKLTAGALGLTLCAAALACVVTWPAPARAAEDSTPFEQKIIGGVLQSLGLRKDGDDINYQERGPLVLPPGRTLPPPEKTDAALASNPAWPKDPDVLKRKKELELESKWRSTQDMENDSRPLRPDQLNPSGVARAQAKRNQAITPGSLGTNAGGERLSASEMGDTSGLFGIFGAKRDDDVVKFTGEQPRMSLTEPPMGYRTPSPDQPYGAGKDRTQPKAYNYGESHGTANPN